MFAPIVTPLPLTMSHNLVSIFLAGGLSNNSHLTNHDQALHQEAGNFKFVIYIQPTNQARNPQAQRQHRSLHNLLTKECNGFTGTAHFYSLPQGLHAAAAAAASRAILPSRGAAILSFRTLQRTNTLTRQLPT